MSQPASSASSSPSTVSKIKTLVNKAIKNHGVFAAEKIFGALVSATTGLSLADHKSLHDWSLGKGMGKPAAKAKPKSRKKK